MSFKLTKTLRDEHGRVVECYYDEDIRKFLIHGSLAGTVIMSKLVFNMIEAEVLMEAFIAGTYDNLRHP